MSLIQITSTLRKSIWNYALSRQRNQLCTAFFKNNYVHPKTFSHNNEVETNLKSNDIEKSQFCKDQILENIDLDTEPTQNDKGSSFLSHKLQISKDRIAKLYPQPVQTLVNFYNIVNKEFNMKESMSFKYEKFKYSGVKKFKCTLKVLWPLEKTFTDTGIKQNVVAAHTARQCLTWLNSLHKIKGSRPLLYSREEIKNLLNVPSNLNFKSEFKNEVETLVNTFNSEIKEVIQASHTININQDTSQKDATNESRYTESRRYNQYRNSDLMDRLSYTRNRDNNLPIAKYRTQILDSLRDNRVLLIKGDTGCGKSSQVPQYILNDYIQNNRADQCNILVAEPRRIAAVSLAERVAAERNEAVGDVVGYHVRLHHTIPRERGSILFCTTGMLLRKLQSDPTLSGMSHVIIDEAHERTLQIDILLNLLKELIAANPSLKIIIMSATMNAELFQKYFSCPVIDVPGKVFPVKMHFLDDIEIFDKKSFRMFDPKEVDIPYDRVVQLIRWILENKPPGGILCFLPGWQEIKYVWKLLENQIDASTMILPLHSKLTHIQQQQVFNSVSENFTKVILATDIAESGITIKDVTYVVDTAVKKDMYWCSDKKLYTMYSSWISQANICQRQGRAGRVRPGESYHLIPKEEYEKLKMYPEPEIFRTSLNQAAIISKTYSNKKLHDFFNNMLEQPDRISVSWAIQNLEELGILDENENLTPLGKRITYFTLDPTLARAVVFASIFQCLSPILSIIVLFTTESELSINSLNDKSKMLELKRTYHSTSDHIALLRMYKEWRRTEVHPLYRDKNNKSLYLLSNVHDLHVNELINSGILQTISDCKLANTYGDQNALTRAILFSGTGHLLRKSDFGNQNGYFTKHADVLLAADGSKVALRKDSVNYKRTTWPSQFLTYINRTEMARQRVSIVPDTSMISPLTVFLFNQHEIHQWKDIGEDNVRLTINNANKTSLYCNEETANLLLNFRNVLWSTISYIVQYEGVKDHEQNLEKVKSFRDKMLPVLLKILQDTSAELDLDRSDTVPKDKSFNRRVY
ncbi:ATP-dependent RNA helicase DHX30-like [Hylaeus volcanicus]|uniref:ATP-dependent RNA helicase DHX30-like n=1 Tax=Hylaeus volcanicus TaxID=313075 RepID=UPI0023B7C2B7|nr:ATP-dependent RNA helicase DHX30-like [Hylaeus volcanicus]XP_053972472.1 ATP-dependent RNA helicase DHX30-like [Hylaeus volcanicus]XP_053972473.1 ATP-dependent RNA helicase DHX30-like [Hylaeus volcanicus]